MKITMIQSLSTPRGMLYQRGQEYEVDDAFGQSLLKGNTATASMPDKPARVVEDRTVSSKADHLSTRSRAEREQMDKARSEAVQKPAAAPMDKPPSAPMAKAPSAPVGAPVVAAAPTAPAAVAKKP